jgi:hypothetical protein
MFRKRAGANTESETIKTRKLKPQKVRWTWRGNKKLAFRLKRKLDVLKAERDFLAEGSTPSQQIPAQRTAPGHYVYDTIMPEKGHFKTLVPNKKARKRLSNIYVRHAVSRQRGVDNIIKQLDVKIAKHTNRKKAAENKAHEISERKAPRIVLK